MKNYKLMNSNSFFFGGCKAAFILDIPWHTLTLSYW